MNYKKIKLSEVKASINRVAATEDGQILFAYLSSHCGFFNNLMSIDDANKTQVVAAIRGVYGHMRQLINREHLIKIEYGIELINDIIERKSKKKEVKK